MLGYFDYVEKKGQRVANSEGEGGDPGCRSVLVLLSLLHDEPGYQVVVLRLEASGRESRSAGSNPAHDKREC